MVREFASFKPLATSLVQVLLPNPAPPHLQYP
jgi:hypothetical protein